MGKHTSIGWTDHTFNPWWGCTRVSPGCVNCYAETWDKRTGGDHWGPGRPRREFGDKHWNDPIRWDRAAGLLGIRRRVFTASMADVFDEEAPAGAVARLFALMRATPNLDWQVLTKRPERIKASLPPDWGAGYPNVWLGTSAESQEWADRRIPSLLAVPAVVHFISAEPLLGPLDDLGGWLRPLWRCSKCGESSGNLDSQAFEFCSDETVNEKPERPGLAWVITGGESGSGARDMDLAWARDIVKECRFAEVPVFVKQLGEPWAGANGAADAKGGDPTEWPEDLRVQEFPAPGGRR